MAFELWMKSPMPMVTLTKTFDVTRLCKVSRKRELKFNMLLCWCIGKTASRIEEFYMLPHDGKLYKYDHMAINVIVDNVKGGLSFCDIAVTDGLRRHQRPYTIPRISRLPSHRHQPFVEVQRHQEPLQGQSRRTKRTKPPIKSLSLGQLPTSRWHCPL